MMVAAKTLHLGRLFSGESDSLVACEGSKGQQSGGGVVPPPQSYFLHILEEP
jgi:hypothetical protein